MKKTSITLPEIQLVGLTARTNILTEMNPQTSKIGLLSNRFTRQKISKLISHRKNPGVVFSSYSDYESNEYGDYTYFIGEEVTEFSDVAEELQTLIIPAANYIKFTTDEGEIPMVVINAWQQIWKMSDAELGGQRAYRADFETYDQRAADPTKAVLDIFIGIK